MTFAAGHSCEVSDLKSEGLSAFNYWALLAVSLKEFTTLGQLALLQSDSII